MISFIVPIYNVKNFLRTAIESILQQNIEKELILIDDGSTDGSLDIALEYYKENSNIILIATPHVGVSSARNRGILSAKGKFIAFLDSDDYFHNKLPLNALCQLAKQRGAEIIKGQISYTTPEYPREIKHSQPAYSVVKGLDYLQAPFKEYLWQALSNYWFPQVSTLLIKRELLIKNNILFDEHLDIFEDSLFFLDLLSCSGNVIEVSFEFSHYTIRTTSSPYRPVRESEILSTLSIIETIKSRLKNTDDLLWQNIYNGFLANIYSFLHYKLNSAQSLLQEKYAHCLTPSMIEFYQSIGVRNLL